jgi:hypothetical protein
MQHSADLAMPVLADFPASADRRLKGTFAKSLEFRTHRLTHPASATTAGSA